jgi:addiction module RelB/DinJ family antitoxin
MSTIQIRIEEKTKQNVKKILDEMGLDMSTAIKLYFTQIKLRNGLPFSIVTKNGLTIQQENEILSAGKEALSGKDVTKELTTKQALKHLDLL